MPKGKWRRERDSNPRYPFKGYTRLAGVRLRPLGHLSTTANSNVKAAVKPYFFAQDSRPPAGIYPHRPTNTINLAQGWSVCQFFTALRYSFS